MKEHFENPDELKEEDPRNALKFTDSDEEQGNTPIKETLEDLSKLAPSQIKKIENTNNNTNINNNNSPPHKISVNSNNALSEKDNPNNNIIDINRQRTNVIFANLMNLDLKEKKLYPLFLITFSYLTITIIELFFGYISNSIVLMADAAHFFSESFCYLIFILSIYFTKKTATSEMSFGFHRGEILGVLVSATILWGFSFWLLYASFSRIFFRSLYVNGFIMILLGIASAFVNLIMGLILMSLGIGNEISFVERENKCYKDNHHHPLDELSCEGVRDSFIHVVLNSLLSCVIILAGIFVYFLPWLSVIDALTTLFLTGILLYNSYLHLEGSIKILMEGSPLEFDVEQLECDLLGITGVIEVHDIHVWSLSIGKVSMSCHLTTTEPQDSLIKARELIKNKYNITHSTIQVELDTERIHLCKGNLH